ncbi:MAG: tyrosine-type recombinase/integrase [Deltaproteobacteria bacterium]
MTRISSRCAASNERHERRRAPGFKEHLPAVGITRNVRWHDLRRTCASSLVSGAWGRSWRIEEVKEVLGHTSIQTTQRYAHLASWVVQEAATPLPASLSRARRKYEGAFRAAGQARRR